MEDANLDDLREELARLEAEETLLSGQRRRLFDQIDHGFASDATRAREREVSAERRQLHQRIDSLRSLLGLPSVQVSEGQPGNIAR